MRIDVPLLAAVTATAVGFSAYWSNPQRPINRVFLSLSLHVALWLVALRTTFASAQGLFWLRITTSVGALIPLHLWVTKETIVHAAEGLSLKIRRGWIWIVVSSALASIPFTEWFIPSYSTSENPVIGLGYHFYYAGMILAYAALFRQAILQVRRQTGVSRVELQTLLLGGCASAGGILLLMGLRAIWGNFWLVKMRPQPLIILFFYTLTVAAITTYRIFDARQLLIVGLQKFALVALVATTGYGAFLGLIFVFPNAIAVLATAAFSLWAASLFNAWLDRLLQFYPEAKVARQAAFSAAQRESRVENLEKAFLSVLRGWGQTDRAIIVSGTKDSISGMGVELTRDNPAIQALHQLVWATPERLMRERATLSREALATFLAEQQLGVLVMVEGLSLTILVGVGIGASRRPITYPQVTQLLELASIMESAMERAHFSTKVQHTEQLATVGLLGASLAHEIRNPLVSIKTFVQLLPTHHQDPAFREKFFRLIGDEVSRIDQLTEQLLDLASPRTYTAQVIELHPVLRASLDLVAAKAAHRSVQFLTDFKASPDRAFTDASAAKQVMLNLCFNAIQAVEQRDGEDRWVRIATRNTATGIEMAVADSGPGISAEIRPRLFQPFQTTKSTGFGLGLAICSDILANLNASITVDPPAPGTGATFRVTFPCQPLSS